MEFKKVNHALVILTQIQGDHGLGLVDLDLGHSTICPVVLGQMGVWLTLQCSWATWSNI